MKKFFQILAAVLILATVSPAAAVDYEFNDDYIRYESTVEAGKVTDPNQLRRMAQLVTYQKLAEQIGEVNVDSTSTLKDACDLDETATFKVRAALRNMRYIKEFKASDGSYHAVVQIYLRELAKAVLKEIPVEDFPPPKFTNIVSSDVTGVIIDCRGKNLSEAIAPAIKSADGTEVYAYKNVGYETAASRSLATYSASMDSGLERAGTSPLRIKAVGVSGGCDVVISAEDADKILTANRSAQFLNKCAVVFVR